MDSLTGVGQADTRKADCAGIELIVSLDVLSPREIVRRAAARQISDRSGISLDWKIDPHGRDPSCPISCWLWDSLNTNVLTVISGVLCAVA